MKKISKLLVFLVLLFPLGVFAANATANNWKLYCDRERVEVGNTAKCYLMAQIQDATDGGKDISAVMVGLTGNKMFVQDAIPAFDSISVTKTLHTNSFSGSIPHAKTTCDYEMNCYDFTSTAIKTNTSLSVSSLSGNNGYTPIGYWEIKVDEEEVTPDSDECARICIDVDYMLSGGTPVTAVNRQTSNANATCQEIKLASKKVCKIENGKYYGPNGEEITEDEYNVQCKKVCRVENGKYYGSNGTEVTEAEYNAQCKKICRYEDGKYYDSNGNEVTKEQYEASCIKVCRVENGKYYGKDGNEITKEQYDRDCIPKTGSFASYAVLVAGALIALSAITIAKKHNRFYRV